LLEEERAIVTPEAGTTRDYLEGRVAWAGVEVRLVDTAGMREATGAAERAGIERSRGEAEGADLLLHVVDATGATMPESLPERPTLVVWNKVDLGVPPPPPEVGEAVACSARTGAGVASVRDWIVSQARAATAGESVACLPRHRLGLEAVARGLGAARQGLTQGLSPELVAFELREAQQALGELIGERAPEAVLEAIFSRFCIGK